MDFKENILWQYCSGIVKIVHLFYNSLFKIITLILIDNYPNLFVSLKKSPLGI